MILNVGLIWPELYAGRRSPVNLGSCQRNSGHAKSECHGEQQISPSRIYARDLALTINLRLTVETYVDGKLIAVCAIIDTGKID